MRAVFTDPYGGPNIVILPAQNEKQISVRTTDGGWVYLKPSDLPVGIPTISITVAEGGTYTWAYGDYDGSFQVYPGVNEFTLTIGGPINELVISSDGTSYNLGYVNTPTVYLSVRTNEGGRAALIGLTGGEAVIGTEDGIAADVAPDGQTYVAYDWFALSGGSFFKDLGSGVHPNTMVGLAGKTLRLKATTSIGGFYRSLDIPIVAGELVNQINAFTYGFQGDGGPDVIREVEPVVAYTYGFSGEGAEPPELSVVTHNGEVVTHNGEVVTYEAP